MRLKNGEGTLDELFERRIVGSSDFVLELVDCLLVLLHHDADVILVELRARFRGEFRLDRFVLWIQFRRQSDMLLLCNSLQLVVGFRVVLYHALPKRFHLRICGLGLSQLAELNLGGIADSGLFHELLVGSIRTLHGIVGCGLFLFGYTRLSLAFGLVCLLSKDRRAKKQQGNNNAGTTSYSHRPPPQLPHQIETAPYGLWTLAGMLRLQEVAMARAVGECKWPNRKPHSLYS